MKKYKIVLRNSEEIKIIADFLKIEVKFTYFYLNKDAPEEVLVIATDYIMSIQVMEPENSDVR